MALSKANKDLLNKFGDSQPALNDPNKPHETSNVKLGDLMADLELYDPGMPANWVSPAPKTIKQALDRLAAAVQGLLSAPIP